MRKQIIALLLALMLLGGLSTLAEALELPECCGANLDALWDFASIAGAELIPMAAEENPGFSFRVEEEA